MCSSKKVIIIGSGLGGMSAALWLASEGFNVELFEKNDKLGGKLNILHKDGFTFDLGPSILTLPIIFERVFKKAGFSFNDTLPLVSLEPQWRNFFADGSVFDLYYDRPSLSDELSKYDKNSLEGFFEFLNYSEIQYDIVEKGYFENGLDTIKDFMRFYPLSDMRNFDLMRTMHQGVRKYVKNRNLSDMLDYFVKYVGSSAHASPGFMNLMPTIQMRYKLWYIIGGMYKIFRAI